MNKTLASIVLAGTTSLATSCTQSQYLRPLTDPIYSIKEGEVNQAQGKYLVSGMKISGIGWTQPELSDRVVEGELEIRFRPLREGTNIVKNTMPGVGNWEPETSKIYVTPVYLNSAGNPATEARFEIGGRFGIPVEVIKPSKEDTIMLFTEDNHRYKIKTRKIDTDGNPETPEVEFYLPVIRDNTPQRNITTTLIIQKDRAAEVIDWETGAVTLRTSPGDIHYFKEIPMSEYTARPLTTVKAEAKAEPAQTVIVK